MTIDHEHDTQRPFAPGTPWELFRFETPEASAPASYDSDDDPDPPAEGYELYGGDDGGADPYADEQDYFDDADESGATVPFDPTDPGHQQQVQQIADAIVYQQLVEQGLVDPDPTPNMGAPAPMTGGQALEFREAVRSHLAGAGIDFNDADLDEATHGAAVELGLDYQGAVARQQELVSQGEQQLAGLLDEMGIAPDERQAVTALASSIFGEWVRAETWTDDLGMLTARHGGDRDAAERAIADAALEAARLELDARKPGATYYDVIAAGSLRAPPTKPARPRFKSYEDASVWNDQIARGVKPTVHPEMA